MTEQKPTKTPSPARRVRGSSSSSSSDGGHRTSKPSVTEHPLYQASLEETGTFRDLWVHFELYRDYAYSDFQTLVVFYFPTWPAIEALCCRLFGQDVFSFSTWERLVGWLYANHVTDQEALLAMEQTAVVRLLQEAVKPDEPAEPVKGLSPAERRTHGKTTKIAQAMSFVLAHPEWSDRTIAEKAGYKSSASLTKNAAFQAAAAQARGLKRELPKGSKTADGSLEAWQDDD